MSRKFRFRRNSSNGTEEVKIRHNISRKMSTRHKTNFNNPSPGSAECSVACQVVCLMASVPLETLNRQLSTHLQFAHRMYTTGILLVIKTLGIPAFHKDLGSHQHLQRLDKMHTSRKISTKRRCHQPEPALNWRKFRRIIQIIPQSCLNGASSPCLSENSHRLGDLHWTRLKVNRPPTEAATLLSTNTRKKRCVMARNGSQISI